MAYIRPLPTNYVPLKVYVEETTERSVCLAVGEYFFQMRSVWVPRGLIKDGWTVDERTTELSIEDWFVRRNRITDA